VDVSHSPICISLTAGMNDPCAPGYDASTGLFHLMYQWNPYSHLWDNISWGAATSSDLVSWTYNSSEVSVPVHLKCSPKQLSYQDSQSLLPSLARTNKVYSQEVWFPLLSMVVLGFRSFIHARRIYRYTGVNLIREEPRVYQSSRPAMGERAVSLLHMICEMIWP